jgi:hypothetical protein
MHFNKINEGVDYFGTMILSMIILPRLDVNWKLCCHAVKKIYKQKWELEPKQFYKTQTIQEGVRTFGRSFWC